MIKTKNLRGAKGVTANRLRDGAVVFLTADGGWSQSVGASAVAETPDEAAALMAAAAKAATDRIVVAPYLFEIDRDGGTVTPVAHREQIRAFGPSIPYATSAREAAQ